MLHLTALDHVNVLRWMKREGIECYGSLFEANQQMIQLKKDGAVDAEDERRV